MIHRIVTALFLAALSLSAWAQNINGRVTSEGRPVEGVCVSDGVSIVRTDADGRYALQSDKRQGFVFISTPAWYTVPLKDGLLPDFYRPLTEPAGVAETHDFQLIPQNQSCYTVLFASDIHIKNDPVLGDKRLFEAYALPNVKRVHARCAADGPVVLFNLGDLAHDKVWYRFDWNIAKSRDYLRTCGYPGPLYSVMGNHDNDGAAVATPFAPDVDYNAERPYRDAMGPTYYSMNIGKDHWIMLDDVIYLNNPFDGAPTDPGLAGRRDYRIGLNADERAWLEKDLETVPEGMNVRVCAHAPFLFEWPKEKGTQFADSGEMDAIYGLFVSRFGKMTAYTGHSHRFQFAENPRYPLLHDLMVPATSGNVWNTGENQMLGIDASDAGIVSARFEGDKVTYGYHTHAYGEKWMRLYDMNTAVEYLRNDERVAKRMTRSSHITDYAAYTGKNEIYANIWFWQPGWTVEMLEGSRRLKVERIDATDPLLLATRNPESYYKHERYVVNKHLFAATARSPRSTITVRILDEDGNLLHSEKMVRPKAFSLDME